MKGRLVKAEGIHGLTHIDVENCPYEGGKCTPIDANVATGFDSSEVLSLMEVMTDYVFQFDPGNIPLPGMICAIQLTAATLKLSC